MKIYISFYFFADKSAAVLTKFSAAERIGQYEIQLSQGRYSFSCADNCKSCCR